MYEKFFNMEVIHDICTKDTLHLASCLKTNLKNYYNEVAYVIQNNTFIYSAYEPIKKDSNICCIVHLDTIGLFVDKIQIMQDIVSPNILYHNGGGYFDDRAGIIALYQLMKEGIYPYIIFTGEEESGCLGSLQLIDDYKELDNLFINNTIQCLIQLDRHGDQEVVFYDLEYPEFEKIFTRFFNKQEGIYSDISVLAPSWNVAAVNLSVGYYKEHTKYEYLDLDSLYKTVSSLIKIVPSFNDYKREDRWVYKGDNSLFSYLVCPDYSSYMNDLYPSNFFSEIEYEQQVEGNFEEQLTSKNDIS